MNWILCDHCEEEFRIITDSLTIPHYCPMCGEDLDLDDDILEEEWEE